MLYASAKIWAQHQSVAVATTISVPQIFKACLSTCHPLTPLLLLLQETEIDRFQAPEEAAAEEDMLRVEREEREKQQIKVSTHS